MEPTERRSPLNMVWKALLALAVSAAALLWAFSGVDLAHVRDNFDRTTPAAVAVYFGAFVLIHFARIARYYLLVAPLGANLRSTAAATSVGIPAAVFLPLRLGELVRPIFMARAGVPFAGALASVVVERAIDGLFNVGVFFTLLGLMPAAAEVPAEVRAGALVALAVFGGALVFLALAYVARERVLGLTQRWLSRLSPALAQRVVGLTSTFLDGLVAIGTWPRVAAFFFFTALYWGLNGFSNWYLATSYGLDLPPLAGPFAISCVVFAVSVPAGPAFAGTLEAGFRVGLAPFGVTPTQAVLVGLVAHVLQLINLALIAAVGFQIAEPSQRRRA